MTPKAKEFIDKYQLVQVLMKQGLKPFVAMAATFEDDDWLLVYSAVYAMCEDLEKS
jgi:hypothetical protein